MVSAPGRRRQVSHARTRWRLSLRRACALLHVARSGATYASKREAADAPAVTRLRELSALYPRYGYRMMQLLLAKQGMKMSTERTHRLWKSAGLQVPRKRPRRRIASRRPRPTPAAGPNHVWAIDFVFDTCADGRQLKCLTIIDEWTRECLAIDVRSGIRAARVVEVLSRLSSVRGVLSLASKRGNLDLRSVSASSASARQVSALGRERGPRPDGGGSSCPRPRSRQRDG